MCGIIGFTGSQNAPDILLKGLQVLEYRGYDSSGMAIGNCGTPKIIKSAGRISKLEEKLKALSPEHTERGIAHTRWATHGKVSDENSHPHSSGSVTLVHNGIIENYYLLEEMLKNEGYSFTSETDTEVAAALIDFEYNKHNNPEFAIFEATKKLQGSFAFAIIFDGIDDKIYAIRRQSPLVAAISDEGSFIASDVTALLEYTHDVYRPDDGVLMVLSKNKIDFINENGKSVPPTREHIEWNMEEAKKGGFPHFMQKEIFEIPEAMQKTLSAYLRNSLPFFGDSLTENDLKHVQRIHIAACGTAMHAGLIGKRLIEAYARIPVNVEVASELRYRNPVLSDGDLMILLSQSGETADTLACLRYAKEMGIPTLAIVNVFSSSIAVEADRVIYTKAGPEIAVASTKAYTVQSTVLALLALLLAKTKEKITDNEIKALNKTLSEDAVLSVKEVLLMNDEICELSKEFTNTEHVFFIGRGIDSDVCTEGSLKLKEISYIHSEAYPAGELKHGTISLISDGVPVIACVCDEELCDKMISGIREVKARGAFVTVFTTEELAAKYSFPCDRTLILKKVPKHFSFAASSCALQLLAYHVSANKGLDVDKPRNLAKSVTVE